MSVWLLAGSTRLTYGSKQIGSMFFSTIMNMTEKINHRQTLLRDYLWLLSFQFNSCFSIRNLIKSQMNHCERRFNWILMVFSFYVNEIDWTISFTNWIYQFEFWFLSIAVAYPYETSHRCWTVVNQNHSLIFKRQYSILIRQKKFQAFH